MLKVKLRIIRGGYLYKPDSWIKTTWGTMGHLTFNAIVMRFKSYKI